MADFALLRDPVTTFVTAFNIPKVGCDTLLLRRAKAALQEPPDRFAVQPPIIIDFHRSILLLIFCSLLNAAQFLSVVVCPFYFSHNFAVKILPLDFNHKAVCRFSPGPGLFRPEATLVFTSI